MEYDFRNIDKKSLNVMSGHTHEALTSRSLAGEQNKSAVTDHAISLNHVRPKSSTEKATEWTDGSRRRYISGRSKTSR